MLTDQLAQELHKPIKRRFLTRGMIVGGADDTWSADLVDIQPFSKYHDGFKYLLNINDLFSQYVLSISLHDKMGKAVGGNFQVT